MSQSSFEQTDSDAIIQVATQLVLCGDSEDSLHRLRRNRVKDRRLVVAPDDPASRLETTRTLYFSYVMLRLFLCSVSH